MNIEIPGMIFEKKEKISADFSYPILSETITGENIFFKNKIGESVASKFDISADRKNVKISNAEGRFKEGTFYSLYMTDDLITDGGNRFPNAKEFDFYVP